MTKVKLPAMTDSAYDRVELVMVTLGSKTKQLFASELQNELREVEDTGSSKLNLGDVNRVIQNLKLEHASS